MSTAGESDLHTTVTTDANPAGQDAAGVRLGLTLAISAYGLWGIMPLYFRWVGEAGSAEVLAHRVFWSVVLLLAVVAATGRSASGLALARDPARLGRLVATGLLIGSNWVIFIYSIEIERVVEASLGYFINPLLTVALGFLVLRERLRPAQLIALLLAGAGVVLETIALGRLPLISLLLAGTFGVYGLIRKLWPEDPFIGLLAETLVLLPVALVTFVVLWRAGSLSSAQDAGMFAALMLAGVVTALPLLCFSGAAARLRLSTLGFTQYIAPSMQFLMAVFLFQEPFEVLRVLNFGLIWLALAIITADAIWQERRKPAFARV